MEKKNIIYVFLFLAVMSVIGYYFVSILFFEKVTKVQSYIKKNEQLENLTESILSDAFEMESTSRGYLLSSDAEVFKNYSVAKKSIFSNYEKLNDLVTEVNFKEKVDKLEPLIIKRVELMDHLLKIDKLNDSLLWSSELNSFLVDGHEAMDEIRKSIKEIDLDQEERFKRLSRSKENSNNDTLITLTVFGIVMLGLVLFAFYILNRAIDKIRSTKDELKLKNANLIEANENLEQFSYVASHDLQEPLRKIRSFGSLLKEDISDENDTAHLYVDKMTSSASRMSILIKDLLRFSRAGRVEEFNEIELGKVLDDVIEDLSLAIKDKSVSLKLNNLPKFVYGTDTELRQLFQNIISNAIKFNDKAIPKINLDSTIINSNNIVKEDIVLHENTEYHQITIADNGLGFENKYVSEIFTVFKRLNEKNKFKGTGIGLSICKKICRGHHGDITATGKLNEGAKFYIYLPVKPQL